MRPLLVDGTNAVMRRAQVAKDAAPIEIANDVYARVMRAADELKATHMAVAFDSYVENERQRIWPEYKAGRTNETRPYAVALAKRFQRQGITVAASLGYEADDVIATLVTRLEGQDGVGEIMTLSSDHDLLALVSAQTTCFTYAQPGVLPWLQAWTRESVVERFGVLPSQLNDFFTLKGGKGFEGLKGAGDKKAAQLIQEHGTIVEMREVLQPADWWKLMLFRAVRMLRTTARLTITEPLQLSPVPESIV